MSLFLAWGMSLLEVSYCSFVEDLVLECPNRVYQLRLLLLPVNIGLLTLKVLNETVIKDFSVGVRVLIAVGLK